MSGAPRLLVIMGSGETAPTMVTTHRDVVARFGGRTPRAALLDTPYGFQENARDISDRAIEHFARRVQLPIEVVGFPGPLAIDPGKRDPEPEPGALARLRAADLVFAGPGSPTYALSVWRGSPVPEVLAQKLGSGGAVVFASAAALVLGRFTLPVYEIYKVGQPLHWLDGLDLLGPVGFGGACVVIPHYDNAEGGTHDTRYCYMGERRLGALEALLPADGWVLGIDEHTALVIDLDAGDVAVTGRGGVTVRRREGLRQFPAGTRLALEALVSAGAGRAHSGPDTPEPAAAAADSGPAATAGAAPRPPRSPLLTEVTRLEQAFDTALAARRAPAATAAILALDRAIVEWSADSLQTDDPDRARAILHALIYRLGEAASVGLTDPRETWAPLVEGLIALRAELRARQAWDLADRLREHLAAAGLELRDTPDGTTWVLRG